MNNNTTHQIRTYLIDYLKNTVPNFQKKGKMFSCPFEHKHNKKDELSANIFPEGSNRIYCFDPDCKFKGDIFDVCRELEFDGDKDITKDDIGEYLIDKMSIKTDDSVEKLFDTYVEREWCMVPVVKNDKASRIESEWQLKNHYDKNEWLDWIYSNINIGVQCGKKSKMFIMDIDAMPKPQKDLIYGKIEGKKASKKDIADAIIIRDENIQKVYNSLGVSDKDTLAQHTFGGVHLVFSYDEDIPKCQIQIDGVQVDIETDGGQCVIEPSITFGYERKFNNNKIMKLPDNIKKLILDQKGKKKKEPEEKRIIVPDAENELSFEKLNGNCNNTFTHLGGILRKSMTTTQTKHALQLFNKLLDVPMKSKDINGICNQIDKYHVADTEVLKTNTMAFLVRHKEAGIRDLQECLGVDKMDMLIVLSDLIEDNKIFKQRHLYKPITKANWKTGFIEESKSLPYQVPYFHNYCTFRRGDMICLGAMPGVGKTHLAMNIIKKLANSAVQPKGKIRYLCSEPGGRFGVIATSLGLKEGDYLYDKSYNPETIELEDDAVTIIDWILPEDFASTGNLYQLFAKQLDRHGGLCIIFSQLNEKTGGFYAPGMIKMFATFAGKYIYGTKNGMVDNLNTKIETEKIRESKVGKQYITIKTKYNADTKTVELA